MITKTVVIPHANVRALGAESTVAPVGFQEKREIAHHGTCQALRHGAASQYVVYHLPLAAILVGGLGTMRAARPRGQVVHPTLYQHTHRGILAGIVEVACYEDIGIRHQTPDGVDGHHEPLGRRPSVCRCLVLASRAAGEVYHKDMQRVVCEGLPLGIEDVPGRFLSFQRCYANRIMVQQPKGEGRVQQRHVHTSGVVRMGHDILVARGTEDGSPGEVEEH